jgi:NAD(P)-dependent dehydrogenase (short-subunit alcohol dehydrogenase family)
MVTAGEQRKMARTLHVVIAGSGSQTGAALADLYRNSGARVSAIPADGDPEPATAHLAGEPIDILIFADDFEAPRRRATELRRGDFESGLSQLAFRPFRIANILRPALAAGHGRLVLLSRSDAGMTIPDRSGAYLERPFRAAAHALWRCLSVEWQPEITCVTIALDSPPEIDAGLLATIETATNPPEGSPLLDRAGNVLPW